MFPMWQDIFEHVVSWNKLHLHHIIVLYFLDSKDRIMTLTLSQ